MKSKCFYLQAFLLILLIYTDGSVQARTETVTAFVKVNLVPMTEETIIPDQTVLVQGTRIAAIGPSNHIKLPENTISIDGSNLYLMPGLADTHIHTDTKWLNGGWPVSPLNLFLANGVTTIRDFGPKGVPVDHALRWRNEIKHGRLQGPTIYAAGPILYGPANDAVKMVHEQKEQGFDFIKPYSFLSKKEFWDAVKTAKELNMYIAGHIPFAVGLDGILAAGMNEIAHIEELDFEFLNFDRTRTLGHAAWFRYILQIASKQMSSLDDLPVDELKTRYQADISKIVRKLTASKIPLCTTLTVGDIIIKKLFHAEHLISRPTSQYLPYGFFEILQQGKNGHQIQFKGHEDFAPFHFRLNQLLLRELHDGGVTLLLGTDSGPMGMGLVPGFSLHDEFRIMIENGFTPYEAIKTATVNAAHVINKMKGEGDFGTLEVGKRADLILVDGNPLEKINNLKKIEGVMASGRWFDKATLQKMIIPGIPVTGALRHVYDTNNTHSTYFEVIIGKTFSGNLPDVIKSITITGPDGKLPIGKEDFTFLPHLRDFWIKVPGIPKIGTYTFEVTSGKKSGSATDIQAEVKTIPLPEVGHFSPLNGNTLKADNSSFSWKTVESEEPLYYRLEINKLHGGRVYSTGYIKGMQSHIIPKGLLKLGQSYRWRIRITDNNNWENIQNRSHCSWQIFHFR